MIDITLPQFGFGPLSLSPRIRKESQDTEINIGSRSSEPEICKKCLPPITD